MLSLQSSETPLHLKFKSLYGKKDDGEMGDNPYAFGLGKRAAYNFGLGKRAQSYTFGLGRKRDPYAFGLGKRADPAYAFGLGKRDPVSLPDSLVVSVHRLSFAWR